MHRKPRTQKKIDSDLTLSYLLAWTEYHYYEERRLYELARFAFHKAVKYDRILERRQRQVLCPRCGGVKKGPAFAVDSGCICW